MKAVIYLNNEVIFESNCISKADLAKKQNEMKQLHGCTSMQNIVKKGFKVFTSY